MYYAFLILLGAAVCFGLIAFGYHLRRFEDDYKATHKDEREKGLL